MNVSIKIVVFAPFARNQDTENVSFMKPKTVAFVATHTGRELANIAGEVVDMLVDSGSKVSMIKEHIIKRCGLGYTPACQMIQGFDGNKQFTVGTLNTRIALNGVECNIHFLVLSENDLVEQGILGRDFLFKPNVKVEIKSDGICVYIIPPAICITASLDLISAVDRLQNNIMREFNCII